MLLLKTTGHAQYHIKPANMLGVVMGAALFGVGMVLYGYWPGAGVVAMASGSLHAVVGFAGMMVGVVACARGFMWFDAHIQKVWAVGKVRLPEVTRVPDGGGFVILSVIAGVVCWLVETKVRSDGRPVARAARRLIFRIDCDWRRCYNRGQMIRLGAHRSMSIVRVAVLLLAACLPVAVVTAAGPVVFRPAYAPGPADNPLKGFVPYAGQGREFPHSLEFGYLSLASLMTGPTNFNWAPLEQLLDGVAARGCQGVFRVTIEYPRKPSGMPQYLAEAGVKVRPWTNTNTQPFPPALDHTPDYEDPRLRAALTHFISALGARYDGDPRIGFITAGLLGTWGEWHCHPHSEWFASRTVQAEVMDAYESAFRKTPVLLRYPAGDGDPAHAPNAARRLGYHDDSFGWATLDTGRRQDDWFFLAAMRKAGAAAMDRWRTAPIGGEIRPELWPCLWKQAGCREGQDFAQCVRETHATWLMDSSTSRPLEPDDRERAVAAARSLGYELQVVQATAALTGRSLEVSVTLTNRGVAPFYADWPVQVLAAGAGGGESSATLRFALDKLMPANESVQSVTMDLTRLPRGRITLFIGIPNPLKGGRPLRFANANSEPSRPGWLTLGEITVP